MAREERITTACVIGLDLGTSGVRAVAVDSSTRVLAEARQLFSDLASEAGVVEQTQRSPAHWWQAVEMVLHAVLESVDPNCVVGLLVDATSGTLLSIDAEGEPLSPPLMYNDAVDDPDLLQTIAELMPERSAAGGATSGLAKAVSLMHAKPDAILHQADWIVGRLTGNYRLSDASNALKTGFDPVDLCWPDWIGSVAPVLGLLPEVNLPGEPIARLSPETCRTFGFNDSAMVIAGMTDGCASFLATGAQAVGDAVTAIGSTLTLKMLSDQPVFAPQFGIYSHRIGSMWLAGGASNTGGAVLAKHFEPDEIRKLSGTMDPDVETGLDYYPLVKAGERFPYNDPAMQPRMEPVPADRQLFLQGLLEGIANIEQTGYQRLRECGAPVVNSLRTVGGASENPAFQAIRERRFGFSFSGSFSSEAAFGSALLALKAAHKHGLLR